MDARARRSLAPPFTGQLRVKMVSPRCRTFRWRANRGVAIDRGFTKRQGLTIRPSYIDAVHSLRIAQAEVHRVCLLRPMGIARHNLPNDAAAVVMDRHARADR